MPSIWKAANHTSYCPSVSCIIFDIDITSWKRNAHQTRSFFVCKDSHKKRYVSNLWFSTWLRSFRPEPREAQLFRYEWILRIECYLPNESRCSYNKRIDSHTTRSTGQPPTVPLHPVIPCFLGTEHQEGVSCPLVVSKRYHICDTFRGT